MRVGILGPLEISVDGVAVAAGGARLRALVVRLALDVGRTVTAPVLADAVWPEGGPVDRVNALQTLVSRLRRLLPAGCVVSVPGGYRLDVPVDAVDAHRFRRLSAEGRLALDDGMPEVAERVLGEALALWRGEPVDELPEARRRGLDEARLTVIEDHAAAALATGRADDLVGGLEPVIAAHPFRERLRVLYIRALRVLGRQAEALAAYERARAFLAEELGADPGAELREEHLATLRDGGAAGGPRDRAAGVRAGGVASVPSARAAGGLVGREAQLAGARAAVAAGRLVALTGPGGVGKTRLAAALVAGHTCRVWWADLVAVAGGPGPDEDAWPGTVVRAVAEAVRVRRVVPLDGPTDLMTRIAEAVGGDGGLLVLDNCEHLAEAAARVAADLLRRCPDLRILVTSREPLRLPEETVYPVPPLAPESAVRLFAARAAAARTGFALTPGNSAVVTEICARLDGLPLAIELAAARLRSLPLDELAVRLDDRFALLDSASRAPDRRHRALRAVVDWSWNLLDDGERRLARRLSVFRGPITVEGAEAVAGGDLRTLTSLADRSLLQFDGDAYRMLETIRAYAHGELVRAGELAAARAAHAAYVLDLAETAGPYLRGPGQIPWLARLAAERDNLRAALRHATESGDAETARRLCAALAVFWLLTGDQDGMSAWTRAALETGGPAPSDATAICGTLRLLASASAGPEAADPATLAEVRRLLPRLSTAHPVAALVEPVLALLDGGPVEAIERRLDHPDGWARAVVRLLRAAHRGRAGAVDGMREDLETAVAGFRAAGERGGLAWSLTALADLRTVRGENTAAIAGLEEAVRLLRELDPDDPAPVQRLWIAEVRARDGDTERARTELLGIVRSGAARSSRDLCFAWITLGDLARRDGDPSTAVRNLDRARRTLDQAHDPEPDHRLQLECAYADLFLDRHDLDRARRHLAAAFDLARAVSDPAFAAIAAIRLARLAWLRGDAETAAETLGAAHAVIGSPGALDAEVTRFTVGLRGDLGEPAYLTAYTRGRDHDPDRALTLIAARFAS
ncbi:MAG TPA: BTAD domain-containing putative transcriptional regulator [Streptosporangiaceae bacterium]|jgi:predicted ATPase/DNA-binding SARP family transcriptional activator